MNSLDLQILEMLSNALNGAPIKEIHDWDKIQEELKQQAVICLPYKAIKKSGCLDNTEAATYQRLCFQNVARNMQLLNEQQNVVDLFERHTIPFVILKGASAAIYYPHPEYRTMGDIDIIVKPEDFERAVKLLDINYQCNQTLEDNPRHIGFTGKTGIEIEVHKYFSFGKKTQKKEQLDYLIYAGIDQREWKEIAGHRFLCLPPIENGLVLLNHIYQHLQGSGVGCRQIIDFRQFVEAEKDNLEVFLDTAKTVGLSGLAEALILIYQRYMGLNINIKLSPISDDVILELMNAFIHSGNFGTKEKMDADIRSANVIKKARNPIQLLLMLQRNGRVHWKASEKYRFLRPFAWIYQICYYFKQLRINGGFSVITKGKARMRTREWLLTELGL